MRVDLQSLEYSEKLTKAPFFRKKVVIRARPGVEGEQVTTTLRNGTQETVNTAKKDDWVVENPDGETYIVAAEKLFSRNEELTGGADEHGYRTFRAKGIIRAIPNDTGKHVVTTAPWGEDQYGDPECLFAMATEKTGIPTTDRYIIGRNEFVTTYEPLNPSQKGGITTTQPSKSHTHTSPHSDLPPSPPQQSPGSTQPNL